MLNISAAEMVGPYTNTYWIGLNNINNINTFVWSDGTPFDFPTPQYSQPPWYTGKSYRMINVNGKTPGL